MELALRWRLRRGRSTLHAYDVLSAFVVLGLLTLVVLTYQDYAVSNDEGVQQQYGELIIRYYASGFTDQSVFHLDNLYLYGGLFDVIATLVAKVLPFDLYSIRHVLCAITGIGGIAAAGAAARMIAGPRAGLFAAVILALCGVWYGGMFNHTKDITFASAVIGTIYMLMRITRDLPRPRLSDVMLFGVMLGAALGLRALGLLLLIYVALAVLIELLHRDLKTMSDRVAFASRSMLVLSPGFLIGYLIMIAAWPWASLEFFNPVRALFAFTHFEYPIHTLLAGHVYTMSEVPRWYIPAYLLIKLPLILLVGLGTALVFATSSRLAQATFEPRARREIGLVALTAAIPVLLHVISHGPAFSGMRHFLFVVPSLAVLAGIGCDALITRLACWRPSAGMAAGVAVIAALLWPASILARLHPHEYLFYNSLVGGLKGADGRYDTDYWVNVLPELVRLVETHIAQAERSGRWAPPPYYTIDVCAEETSFKHENKLGARLRPTEDWDDADFFIGPTHMHCDQRVKGRVIATVKRMGVVIGVVKEGPAAARARVAQNKHQPSPWTARSRAPLNPLNKPLP